MAVGATAFIHYEAEDVIWTIPLTAPGIVTDITGWVIELVVKETAADLDPPLVGAITATITGLLEFKFAFNVDLDPGSFVYSARRVDSGFNWQLAHGPLTVLDSASIDI